ncbi:MAG: Hpt domain-containing protein [Thermodesulfobacteriota bacterium]
MEQDIFRAEAEELLDDLEAALLELEARPDDRELVNRVFRALHTVKGSGKMFGFDAIAAFVHQVETVYDAVRDGRLTVDGELISRTLAARDVVRRLLRDEDVPEASQEAILAGFSARLTATASRPAAPSSRAELARPAEIAAGVGS